MLRDCVAFVAAPYGFGPSSKAVAISSYLPRWINRTFFGDGPALKMAQKSNQFSSCLRLDFSVHEAHAAEILAEHPVVVFINSMRFLRAASRACEAVIFVDTLAWLRTSPCSCSKSLKAYFAQRFFDHPFPESLNESANFQAVGAIVPKTLIPANDGADIEPDRKSPIVHCGGLFSPAMRDGADISFAGHLFETLESVNVPLRIIAPQHLSAHFASRSTREFSLLDCTPVTVPEHILGSSFALTTSGIEFTYESMLLGVPTLFLPPFNTSQHLQLQYHRRAFDGSIQFRLGRQDAQIPASSLDQDTAAMQVSGMLGGWKKQFDAIASYLMRTLTSGGTVQLRALREAQTEAVRRVGRDGAQTIAAHVIQELSSPVRMKCVSQST